MSQTPNERRADAARASLLIRLTPELVKTDSVLGSRYVKGAGATLTHAVDGRTGNSLCARIAADAFAGDPSLKTSRPTCKACAKRDPRAHCPTLDAMLTLPAAH